MILFLIPLAFLLSKKTIDLRIDPARVVAKFDPGVAFGAGLDGHERGENGPIFSSASLASMKSAGYGRFTYRLRTELAGEAWHWNPDGRWSDPKRREGYWTSNSKPGRFIRYSYGYRLPRRGNTLDQANNDGYSRLDDGNLSTFWKSNPYLDPRYGGTTYAKQPQWVVLDLGRKVRIDEVRIAWGEPFAKSFDIQRWDGSDDLSADKDDPRDWVPFKRGVIVGQPGEQRCPLEAETARFIRVRLLASSGEGPAGATDARDRIGFAIREIWAGSREGGAFADAVHHSPTHDGQSLVYVSSTDPWHRAADLDPRVEQPGFDLFFRSSLIRGKPCLMPVPALYDTPENVAAEVRWLRARRYPVEAFEVGEEPDGQYFPAESYADLYAEMADQIRAAYPEIAIGGPSLQTVTLEFRLFPDRAGPWLTRFLSAIRAKGKSKDFQFCSFEWYPFDNVAADPARRVPFAPRLLANAVYRLKALGMRKQWRVTEYGYSAFGGQPEVELSGAIFNLDTALTSLKLGASTTYLYGLEPNELIEEVKGQWGNNMLFLKGDPNIPLPTFYGAWLMTSAFCERSGTHRILGCSGGTDQVGCYPVRRPDGRLAVVLVNRLPSSAHVVLSGGVARWTRWSYSAAQYVWKADGDQGHPTRDLPPKKDAIQGSALDLPGWSITVLVGRR